VNLFLRTFAHLPNLERDIGGMELAGGRFFGRLRRRSTGA
jgi:hypothetical protein